MIIIRRKRCYPALILYQKNKIQQTLTIILISSMKGHSLKTIEQEAVLQALDFIDELRALNEQSLHQESALNESHQCRQLMLHQRLKKSTFPLIHQSFELEQAKKNVCAYISHYFQIQATIDANHFSKKQIQDDVEAFFKQNLEEFNKNNTEILQKFNTLIKGKNATFTYQKFVKMIQSQKQILQKNKIEKLLKEIVLNFDQIQKQNVIQLTKKDKKSILQLFLEFILRKAQHQRWNQLYAKVLILFNQEIGKSKEEFYLIKSEKEKESILSVFPFFFSFGFVPTHFNIKGHKRFPDKNVTKLKVRGGIPYFQPIYGQKFGLNVQNIEAYGDNNWLSKNGQPTQWAVGFIGVNSSDIFVKNTKKHIDFNINLCEEFMFGKAVNKQQKIGIGLAISPLFSHCLLNFSKPFTKSKQKYRMVLQCRFKPQSIKCTKDDKIWIINYKRDVRPYAIVIFTDEQTQKVAKLKDSAFKPFWKWSQFKNISKAQLQNDQQVPTEKLTKIISQPNQLQNIKLIDLSSHNQKQKLTSEDMSQLVKVVIPNVQQLNLQGNAVGDQGIQFLCQTKYNNLKQIDLNDNGISLNGVSSLISNTWNKQVVYKLDNVSTKDGGYALKAGENIKTIKSLIQNSKTIRNDSIDQLESSNKKKLYQALHLLMETPLQGKPEQVAKQSLELQQNLKQAVANNPISTEQVLLALKNTLGSAEITFSKATNVKSQLSIKILTSGMEDQNVMIRHRIVDKQWNFKDFKNNSTLIANFEQWYKKKIAKQYNADVEDITIHKITEGSVQVWMSLSRDNFLIKNKDFPQKEELCVIPFFGGFNLSLQDFEASKNYQFPNSDKCDLQWRAGIPYFQPVKCKRFAIKVLNLYDAGNNSWLSMDGIAGQWGIAFHGINFPGNVVPQSNKTVLQSIMSGRQTGEMLRGGAGQAYQGSIAVNKPGVMVGYGIYVSPHFTTSLFGYTRQCKMQNQSYYVLLQCRFKPQALKCTDCRDYWVINESKDVRPYGIILVTPEQYQSLNQIQGGLYSQNCDWNTWKQQFQQFRNGHGLPI